MMRTISQTDFARRIISRYMPPDSSAPDSADMLFARDGSIDRLVQSVRNTYLIDRTSIENTVFNLHIQLSFLNSVFGRTLRKIHESAARHIQMLEKRPASAIGRNTLPIASPDRSSPTHTSSVPISLQYPLPSAATDTRTALPARSSPSTHRLVADAAAQSKSEIVANKLGRSPRGRAEEREERRLGISPPKAILPASEQQGKSADPATCRSGDVDFARMSEFAPANLISLPELSPPGLQHALSAFWGAENGIPIWHRHLWGYAQTGGALPGAFDPQGLEPRAARPDSLAPLSITRTSAGRLLPELRARTTTEQFSRAWEYSLDNGFLADNSSAARPGKNAPLTGLRESNDDLRRSVRSNTQRPVEFPDAGKTAAIPVGAADPTAGITRHRPILPADMQKPRERTIAEPFTRNIPAAQPMQNIPLEQPTWNTAQPARIIPVAQLMPDEVSSAKGLSVSLKTPSELLKRIPPPGEAAWLPPNLLHAAQGLIADPAEMPRAAQGYFDISMRQESPVLLPHRYAATSRLREQTPRQGGAAIHAGTLPSRRSARIDPPFTPPPSLSPNWHVAGTVPTTTDIFPRVMLGLRASSAPTFRHTSAASGFVPAGWFASTGADRPLPSGGTANTYTASMSMISPYAAIPAAFAQSPRAGQPPKASGAQSLPVPIVYKREAPQRQQTEQQPGIGEDIEFIKKNIKQPGKTQVATNTAVNLPGGTHYSDAAQNTAAFQNIDGQVNAIADKVYRALERRLRSERMRKGML